MASDPPWLQQNALALYGAVLATFVFVRQIIESRRATRRRLRVSVSIAQMHQPNAIGQYHFAGHVVDFKALNIGTLEVGVTQCGLARAQHRFFRRRITRTLALVMPSGPLRFPYNIPTGQSASFQADVPTWCRNPPAEGWRHYGYIYFQDALGQNHIAKTTSRFFDDLEVRCAAAAAAE